MGKIYCKITGKSYKNKKDMILDVAHIAGYHGPFIGKNYPSLASILKKIGHSQFVFYDKYNKVIGVNETHKKSNSYKISLSNISFEVISKGSKKADEGPSISFNVPGDVGKETWGLEHMNLLEECADFYTLYELTLDYPDDSWIQTMFKTKKAFLAEQFSRYLDMAIGGELRHCHNLEKYFDIKDRKTIRSGSRHSAWVGWKMIRDAQGIEALATGERCFKEGIWGSSFGGKNWGKVAEVLLRHLKDEDTEMMFVDTVWSLQHNTGSVLNKFWQTSYLNTILDIKFKGDIKRLVDEHRCTTEIMNLYKERHANL